MPGHSRSWITESIIQFSYSPMWRNPVNNFIDDNCYFFNTDDEMKFEYTAIHNQFKVLVDKLLTDFVNELGVPLEEALQAIQKSTADKTNTELKATKRFMKFIYCVNDFRTFYRMMVTRNIELDILATAQLSADGINVTPPARPDYAQDHIRDDLAFLANGDVDEEEALRLAIAASMNDQEMADKKMKLVDASLQEELAYQIQDEAHKAATQAREAQQLAAPDAHAAKLAQAQRLNAIEQQKELNIRHLEEKTLAAREANVLKNLTASEEQKEMSVQSVGAHKLAATSAPERNVSAEMVGPGDTPPPAPPVTLPPQAFGAKKALPPISQPPLEQLKTTVGAKMAAAPPTAAAAKAAAAPKPAEPAKGAAPTKEELEAKAKYMREQRQKILEKNKAARQKELENYAKENSVPLKTTPDANAENKQLTVDIARRLREDIVRESKK